MPIITSSLGSQRPDLSDAIYQYDPAGVNFKADEIFPPVNVNTQAGTIEVVTRESLLKLNETLRTPGAGYNRINNYLEPLTYNCKDYGLEYAIDYGYKQTIQYNQEEGAMRAIKMGILNKREYDAMALLLNTSTWTGAALYTDVATTWVTVATCDPVANVIAAKKKVRDATGVEPNAVIMSQLNFDYCLQSTLIRGSIQYTEVPTLQAVANSLPGLFGVDKVIVPNSRYDSGGEGISTTTTTATASDSYVSVARLGVAGDVVSPSVGHTLVYDEDSGLPYVSESYWQESNRSMIYRVRHNIEMKVIDPYFAHLLKVD